MGRFWFNSRGFGTLASAALTSGCCLLLPPPQKISLRRSAGEHTLLLDRCPGHRNISDLEVSVENLTERRELCVFQAKSPSLVVFPPECGRLKQGSVYRIDAGFSHLIVEIGPSGEPIPIFSHCESG